MMDQGPQSDSWQAPVIILGLGCAALALVAGIVLCAALVLGFGFAVPTSGSMTLPQPHTIVYRVSGDAETVSILYVGETGNRQEAEATLPWMNRLDLPAGDYNVWIEATADGGDIRCLIEDNGQVLVESDPSPYVTCGVSLQNGNWQVETSSGPGPVPEP